MNSNSKGFTLIEMIVVMAIFLVVVGAALNIFISIIKSENKLLAQQQALSQVAYIEQYMGNAIRAAVEDTSGTCLGTSNAGNFYNFSDVDTTANFYNSIEFLNGSDMKFDTLANKSEPSCDEFYVDANGILEEIKSYSNDLSYNMTASPVAVSSSSFDISSIRFAVDGLNQKVVLNNKPIFLADSNKNYLGGIQLAALFSPTPSPIQSPVYCDDNQDTDPNPECPSGYCDSSHNVCTDGSEGVGCRIPDDCNVGLGLRCINGFCTNPSNVAPPTKVDGQCGWAATTYLYTDTGYGVTPIFCYSGIVDPSNPSFPTPGGSVTWTCDGIAGGNPSGTCTASRASAPTTISTKESFVTFVITFKIPGINQVITIQSSVTRPI